MNEKGEPINKGNIYISKTSPAGVLVAYREQFEQDFTSFLKSRGQEIVPRGRMVVNIMATTDTYGPQDYFMTDVLNVALKDMAMEVNLIITSLIVKYFQIFIVRYLI